MTTLDAPSKSRPALAARFAAFVAERHPFALKAALAAFERGDDIAAALREALQTTTEIPETTPGVAAGERLQQALSEVVEDCKGFFRREEIAASLTPDERREILRGMLRHAHGPMAPNWTEIADIPRARGALWSVPDAALIASVKKYADTSLAPDETFFDFTNRGILYFLLNRDCPVREEEVAYYEPEGRQRAVIAALDRNRHVRAALVPKAGDGTAVDGIPNERRAPLVWEYVRTHFHPDFEEGDVVFWRRNE